MCTNQIKSNLGIKTKRFYDIHVFFSRNEGYSIPFCIESEEEVCDEDEIIKMAVDADVLDSDDCNNVDTVIEIDEQEYNDMKGEYKPCYIQF